MASDSDSRLRSTLEDLAKPDPAQSAELVRRASGGDDFALGELLERYRPRLRRIVRIRLGARLRGRLESMDIVQEAYQVAVRKISEFEMTSPSSILQWLSRIAEHKISDADAYFAALRRDVGREEAADGAPDESGIGARLAADKTSPPEAAERAETREIMDDCVEQLSDAQREVVILRDYCGGDWEFVAAELDSNPHAAQELHRRAWVKLRELARSRMGTDE